MQRLSASKADSRARTPPPGFGSGAKRSSAWDDASAPVRTSRSSGASTSRNSDVRILINGEPSARRSFNGEAAPRRSRVVRPSQNQLANPFAGPPAAADTETSSSAKQDTAESGGFVAKQDIKDSGLAQAQAALMRQQGGELSVQAQRRAAAAAICAAASDPGTADAALLRMARWADSLCGPPRRALTHAVHSHAQLSRAIQAVGGRARPGAGPRQLGKMVTEAWVDARRGNFLDNLGGFDVKQFCGLMMYLEMAVTLVPDVTGHRLLCIWDLDGQRGSRPTSRATSPQTSPLPAILHSPGETSQPATPRRVVQSQPMPDARAAPKRANSDPRSVVSQGEPEPDPTTPAGVQTPKITEPSKPLTPLWSTMQAFKFCKKGSEESFNTKVKLLPEATATSVKGAVDYLNQSNFSEPCVMIFTPSNNWYYCVYQRGHRQMSLNRLQISEPCGVLSVRIVAAYSLRNTDGWKGKSDPLTVVAVGTETCQTNVIKDSLNPVWNADPFQFQVNYREEERSKCSLEVLDFSKTGESESLGVVKFDIPSMPPKQKIRKIDSLIDKSSQAQGQLEYEVEFVPKRDLTVAEQTASFEPSPSGARGRSIGPRRGRKMPKPDWSFFERELVYQEEVERFLSSLGEVPSSPLQLQDVSATPSALALPPPAYLPSTATSTGPTAGRGNTIQPLPASAQAPPTMFPVPQAASTFQGPASAPVQPQMPQAASTFSGAIAATATASANVTPVPAPATAAASAETPSVTTMPPSVTTMPPSVTPMPPDTPASAPRLLVAGIEAGTVLRCTSEEGSTTVFENAASDVEIDDVKTGQVVTVAGPPVHCDGFWMVPIRPNGAVQLDQFEKVNLDLTAPEEKAKPESFGGGAVASKDPMDLDVMIISATGLKKRLFARTPDASVSVEVPGKGYTTVKTRTIREKDPAWDELLQISGYVVGDVLEFSVWDRETVIGQASMTSDQFLPNSFEGFLKLSLEEALLRVSVSRATADSKAKLATFRVRQEATTFNAGDRSKSEDPGQTVGVGLRTMGFLSRLLPGRSGSPRGRLLRAAQRVEVAGSSQ